MTKVRKTQLTERVSKRADVSLNKARELITHVFAAITEELAKGNSVNVSGFGTWRIKVCTPRLGRDLRTGHPITIPPRTRVAFKAGAGLRRSAESSIDPSVFFGQGAPRRAELDSIFGRLFGGEVENLGVAEVRKRIQDAIGTSAGTERDALEFFNALWNYKGTPVRDDGDDAPVAATPDRDGRE